MRLPPPIATLAKKLDALAKKGNIRQPVKVTGSLSRITDLNLSSDRIQLMKNSVFYKLVQVKHSRQGSAPMDSALCKFYDPINQCFVFNDKTSLRFCTKEVANVLGIEDGGDPYKFVCSKDNKIPDFVETLKKEHSVQGTLEIKHLRLILQNMKVDDEERKVWFKKLMSYYVVDQLLMCSSNTKIVRKNNWRVVEDLETFEKINWAKIVYDSIHEALGDLKMKMDKPGEHAFKGAPLVFEAIMFERISSLRPSVSQFVDPPIQKYTSQRKSKWSDLAKLGPEMINKCNFCSSRGLDLVVAEDGDVAEDVVEPGAVKENVVEPTDMVEIDVESMAEIDVEIDVESTALGKNDDEPTAAAENVEPTAAVANDEPTAENVEPTAAAAKVDDALENRLATMNMQPKYEKPKRDIKPVDRFTYDEKHFNPRKNTGKSAGRGGRG